MLCVWHAAGTGARTPTWYLFLHLLEIVLFWTPATNKHNKLKKSGMMRVKVTTKGVGQIFQCDKIFLPAVVEKLAEFCLSYVLSHPL